MKLSVYRYRDFVFVGNTEGGLHTTVAIPRFKLMFDTGIGSPQLTDYNKILLTHGHLDHSSGVAYLVSQRSLRKLEPPEIYVPPQIYEPLDQILKLWNEIEQYESRYKLIKIQYDQLYPLQGNYYFQAIPSYHRIPSHGYVIFEKKQKLKKEFIGLPGHEIAELKKTNPDIIETKWEPVITFSGDTKIEFVLNNEVVQNSKILFLECTYICEKRNVERARRWGHIHLFEIIENAEYFRNVEKLYLMHFSPRYTNQEILDTLKRLLPKWLYEITTPFLTKKKTEIEYSDIIINL
ncbi:MAG: MBL fold metallo-hydrolase [Leptospiraceae bacterium]|nr:MBL fold metallo-hydrolase [Leptospiraceae bacterium]MDW7976414.1 MBL fold metallo-hydrolase [Leptospiraceae bacterium]